MRWRTLFTLVAVAALGVAHVGALRAQDSRPGLGVLPFYNGGSYGQNAEDYQALEVGIQQMLITELAQNAGLRVVERSRLKELLQEQDLGASGRVDHETAARLGRVVGAKYMIKGGFTDVYGNMRLDLQVVNSETSEIMHAEKVTFKSNELLEGVVRASGELIKNLKLPALSQASRDQRETRAKEIPAEAVRYYTRGLLYADRGDTARAKELFSKAKEVFPAYTEVDVALQQLGG